MHALVLALPWVLVGSVARAEDPPPGWARPAPLTLNPRVDPLELRIDGGEGVLRVVRDLAGEGRWDRLARAVDRALTSRRQRVTVARRAGPSGARVGSRIELRRRLLALPSAALTAYRELRDAEARELLEAGRTRPAALRRLLARYALCSDAAAAARLLGERALERGDAEGGLLLWREAAALDSGAEVDLRSIGLRARPTFAPGRAGALGVMRSDSAVPKLSWARRTAGGRRGSPPARAVVACAERVYFADTQRILAADRSDGRLVWQASAPPPDALSLVRSQLISRTARAISAYDPRDGSALWRVGLEALVGSREPLREDSWVDLVTIPQGMVALATLNARWLLVGLDDAGRVRWRTPLWKRRESAYTYSPLVARFRFLDQEPCPEADCASKEPAAEAGRHHPERSSIGIAVGAVAPPRRILRDGRLAAVSDRIFLTADGVVLAAEGEEGAVLWVRERAFGLSLAEGGAVRVGLSAGAYAVEAVTAAGLFVRLDPLDGSLLPTPASTHQETAPCYRLGFEPLVLGWRGGRSLSAGGYRASLGVRPWWPGTWLRSRFVLPTEAGLVLWLPGEEPAAPIAWPLGPARVLESAGALLVANARGIALFEVHALSSLGETGQQHGIAALGNADWRVRLAARASLAQRLEDGDPALVAALEDVATDAPELESRRSSLALLARHRRLARWRTIAPEATKEGIRELLEEPTRARLLALCSSLPKQEAAKERAIVALSKEVLEADEPKLGATMLELLAFLDRRTCGRLVALIRTTQDEGAKHDAAALLVAVAQRGGSKESVSRLMSRELRERMLTDGPVTRAIVLSGDLDLWKEVGGAEVMPLPALREWFLQNPGVRPDPASLLEELGRFLRKRGGGE